MSAAPATIARRTRRERSTGFERLRAAGLQALQQGSGGQWTDHNLHDPGITQLEVLCFALTELAYRAEFPMADLLTGPDGRLDFAGLALHPPQQALPCQALTTADHRRRLLDHVPGLDDAGLRVLQPGVLQLQVKLSDTGAPTALDPAAQQAVARLAARTWRAERPLGEDLAPEVQRVGEWTCDLLATLELGGAHEPAEVLAEVYYRVATVVDRVARLYSRRELLEQGLTLEQLHDGPEAEHGFAVADHGGHAGTPAGHDESSEMLYVDDLTEAVRQVPGVKAVVSLALQLESGDVVRGATPWVHEGRLLRLRVPGRPGGVAPQGVVLQRRTHQLAVDPADLWRRVQDRRMADRGQRLQAARALQDQEAARLPVGRWRPPAGYGSVQQHFPPVYGLGVHGVPASYGVQRQAQARQLQAYLALFDQILANGQAQLSHLHQLFSARQAAQRTVWWQLLGETEVPGLQGLMATTPQAFEAEVLQPLDASAPRRHRLLDHLLALHGEELSQNAMRLHCGHLSAQELDALQLRNKAAWLQQVVGLSRLRGCGFNDARRAWPEQPGQDPDNTCGLVRRVALLLGFAHSHARPLAPPPPRRVRHRPLQRAWQALQADPALLRAAAAHSRFHLEANAQGRGVVLFLRLDNAQLALARGVSALRAQRLQRWLRHAALAAHDAAEGLHLVEHVLLRPLAPGASVPPWNQLRLTAVFPRWTVRTAQPAFRQLAEETLRLNCPAHLVPQALWLEQPAMAAFEADWGLWLRLRRDWVLDPNPQLRQRLDQQSARVAAHLRGTEAAP